MTIATKVDAWFGAYGHGLHTRHRSGEHCYCFFQSLDRSALGGRRDDAALQLGFYLASWTLLAHPHRPRPASPEPGPAAGPAFPWVFAFWVCGGLPGRNGPGAQTGNGG
jgi:hypothetical protein